MRSTAPANLTCSRKMKLLSEESTSPRSNIRERSKTANIESTSSKMYGILIDSFKVNRSPREVSPREVTFTHQTSSQLYSGVNIYQQSLKGGNVSARQKAASSVELTQSERSCSSKSSSGAWSQQLSQSQSAKASLSQTSDNRRITVGVIPLNLNVLSRPRSHLVTSVSARSVIPPSHTQQFDHSRISMSASNTPRFTMSMQVPLNELPPPPATKPPENPYQTCRQSECNYNRTYSVSLPVVQVIN